MDRTITFLRGIGLGLIITMFVEMSVLNENSVDPDQTPSTAASDLGLYCLTMHIVRDAKHHENIPI